MLLIDCKVELKLKCTKHCILATRGNFDDDTNFNNIFTIKGTKLYVPIVTLSPKDNEKLLKLFSKRVERSVYWYEYKTKNENKNTTNKYRNFSESNFVGVNRLFVLAYSSQDNNAKRYKSQRYDLPKGIIN